MKTNQQILDEFKAADAVESVELIMSDVNAKRILAAWPFMGEMLAEDGRHHDTDDGRWRKIWKILPDADDVLIGNLSRSSGVAPEDCRKKLQMLYSTRMIYPDGTISRYAGMALRRGVMQRLGIKDQKKVEPKK